MPRDRLAPDVRPTHYALALEVLPDRDSFRGTVRIAIDLDQEREGIWLHARDLSIEDLHFELPAGERMASSWQPQADVEGMGCVLFERRLGPGSIVLHARFQGAFNRQLEGLYRVETGGHAYAFTQFQSVSARLVFPCFDEPGFKATFDVSLTVRQEHVAIANSRALTDEALPGGLKRVIFATTEKLPTYLLALAVGPLAVFAAPDIPPNAVRSRPLPFRGVATYGRERELGYALAHTPAQLEALEEYFGSEYPFDKLDIIAVPDFASGAMENPGAVTFREQLLLLDEQQAPEDQRRQFAEVMAHELAHMWFGNVVTMSWWDDLWLNESFAEWMGNRIVQTLYPDYQAGLTLLEYVHGAMHLDSLLSARQIRQPVQTGDDIENAFDGITYEKGMGLLAMFERWLGEDTFRRGIRLYIDRHRHGNADAGDLLAALSQVSGVDVSGAFESFLLQSGVPLLEARVRFEGGKPCVQFRQSRYLPVGSSAEPSRTWVLPVCFRYAEGQTLYQTSTMLDAPEGTVPLQTPGRPTWLLPNADGAGYYRWFLETEDLDRLRELGWTHLSSRERLSFADSLRAAFDAARIPAAGAFGVFELFAADENRAVALAPTGLLRFTKDPLLEEALHPRIEHFGRELYQPVLSRLGWDASGGRPESGETRLLRQGVLEFLAFEARDPEVRHEASVRGRKYLGFDRGGDLHPEAVSPELLDIAVAVAIQDGGQPVLDAALQHFLSSEVAFLRSRLLRAVASTKDPELAARVRALALDPRLRVNEVMLTLDRQRETAATRTAMWTWFQENFDAIVDRIGHLRAGGTPAIASRFATLQEASDVEAFFEPRIDGTTGGRRNLASAIETIRLRAARVVAQAPSAREFFLAMDSRP